MKFRIKTQIFCLTLKKKKKPSASESGPKVGVLTHSPSLSIGPENLSDTLGTETVKVH